LPLPLPPPLTPSPTPRRPPKRAVRLLRLPRPLPRPASRPEDPPVSWPDPAGRPAGCPIGRALAAPPARAPAATPTAPQHPDDPGAGTDAEDGRAFAASRPADPANDDGRPGRAAGMLPAGGAPMSPPPRTRPGIVAPTPSAANFARQAPAAPLTPAHVNFRPGRAGGRLADMPAPGAAPAATAAAIAEAAVAADAAAQAADQVTAQEPVETTYAHNATEFKCSVCAYVAGSMATLVAHRRSAHRFADIFDSGCACSLVFHSRMAATSHALACAQRATQAASSPAVPMDVDQGHTPPGQRRPSPRRPSERRSDGKRRRLNSADDEDAQKLAEHLQLVDEDGVEDPPQAHKPSAASALSATVLAVYVHNAHRFTCTLCTYTAASFGTLQRHRDTRHRRVAFQDRFLAGCACGMPFASRPAAARHAKACAGPRTPMAEAPRSVGASSHADREAEATVDSAATAKPPRSSLRSPPPQASSTDVDIQGQEAEAEARGRWGPPLPREVVAARIADRLGEIEPPRWGPPLPRALVASRIAGRLEALPAPRWNPPLPRDIVASRIADRLVPPTLAPPEE
ncbi:hypothetical protein PR003_g31343, partial [Phytophthora rubi]